MFDDISHELIKKTINELVGIFGVKESIKDKELSIFHDKKIDIRIEAIAKRYGLPVKILLSYVPANYSQKTNINFESKKIVLTDSEGRGNDSITAQVIIPDNMPCIGDLNDYPIKVLISENCIKEPVSFIAIMAHELSHVLLKAIRHPLYDNELYADILPLIFGFSSLVENGRKVFFSDKIINYGYLNDDQFNYAVKVIWDLLEPFKHEKERLLKVGKELEKNINNIENIIISLDVLIKDLSKNFKNKISEADGKKISKIYAVDIVTEYKTKLEEKKRLLADLSSSLKVITHYKNETKQAFNKYNERLNQVEKDIGNVEKSIQEDLHVLRRNFSFSYRIKNMMQFK